MSKVMEDQRAGRFDQMSERDREIQASFWSLIFLVSEMALAFRALREKLKARGALLPEDDEMLDRVVSDGENLQLAYDHIERAFRDKYERVFQAMASPAEVTQIMADKYGVGRTVDLNDPNTPTVTGTY